MTDTPKLNAFGVVVADMARALTFYRDLGLDIPADADAAPHVGVDLGGGVSLMFDTVETVRSFDPEWQPPKGSHRVGLAFRCATPAGVDAAFERMLANGHRGHKPPWDAFWGQRYAMLLDPDGNSVELYAPLETSD